MNKQSLHTDFPGRPPELKQYRILPASLELFWSDGHRHDRRAARHHVGALSRQQW